MTPKIKGLAGAMAKLQHGLDDRADKLLKRIDVADQRSGVAFDKANKSLDAAEASMGEVEQLISSLEGSNGAPATANPTTGTPVPPLPNIVR